VHKLVTGRYAGFDHLRQAGGLSGYPSRAESPHDWIENSHASTVLSYAHGLDAAQRLTGGDRRIVAVIGDGSMTGGMAFEGLNNLGHAGSNVTIVLNDNGRSYAPTVSKLSESLVRIRSNPVYMQRQARLEKLAESVPFLGEPLERGTRPPSGRSATCGNRRRSSSTSACATWVPSTAMTSRWSRRPSPTPSTSTARSSCTC
jgi:1-deoxy-D-xylulose-5-phosphate synthase